ncbi:Expansin-A20 [Pleodorina starrii]|uniref:Expansin-A20 n=1 Tax=Pleodorina starrii TaxID=330485 RepID=A0A9W6B8G3_9CHLO|nr:Expansin-A20 [Pleodorina starrii]GLC47741.1 Expansin-A20 [Pleodorina starrii]GLC70847.1 Expansin-A20 [Pleodorina starrii]
MASSAAVSASAAPRGRDNDRPAAGCCSGSSSSCGRAASTTSSSSPSLFRSLPLLMLSALLPFSARAQDWHTGRATFYGYDGGATIDQGSCMYGPLPNSMVSTGRNIAALSDADWDFSGSCGRCYEVQCNPGSFTDGYGNYIDRSGACYQGTSVIVTITDSCPCNYPANQYSNSRWCCGDMYHMDLSQEAFSAIGDISQGVMGITFRQVDCPGGFIPSPRKATSDYLAGTGQ